MNRYLLLIFLWAVFSEATAIEVLELLPDNEVRPLLDRDPSVLAAQAALEAARREADLLERSPYEWTARATGQRRSIQDSQNYREWNVGIEHAVRLPAKSAADRAAASATLDAAQARRGEALHEAAKTFLNLYMDWQAAEQSYAIASRSRLAAEDNAAAVGKRLRGGDASQLDNSLALADLAEEQRTENEARMLAATASARLQARFPDWIQGTLPLPSPPPIQEKLTYWRERILQQSDELKIAQAAAKKSQAQAERARAERMPDPTVGAFTASEMGGNERIIGISVSVPIPTGRRGQSAAQAEYAAQATQQDTVLVLRQLEGDIASLVTNTQGAYKSAQMAESVATTMEHNATLTQRAYALGETDLQVLLLVRRQAAAAAQSALANKVAALRAYYLLMIDAHRIWELEHDD